MEKHSPRYHTLGHKQVLLHFKRLKLYGEKRIYLLTSSAGTMICPHAKKILDIELTCKETYLTCKATKVTQNRL